MKKIIFIGVFWKEKTWNSVNRNFKESIIGISYLRYHAMIVFVICLILLRKYKMNPILVMVLAGISEVVIQMI